MPASHLHPNLLHRSLDLEASGLADPTGLLAFQSSDAHPTAPGFCPPPPAIDLKSPSRGEGSGSRGLHGGPSCACPHSVPILALSVRGRATSARPALQDGVTGPGLARASAKGPAELRGRANVWWHPLLTEQKRCGASGPESGPGCLFSLPWTPVYHRCWEQWPVTLSGPFFLLLVVPVTVDSQAVCGSSCLSGIPAPPHAPPSPQSSPHDTPGF